MGTRRARDDWEISNNSSIGSLTRQCRQLGLCTLGDRPRLIKRLKEYDARVSTVPPLTVPLRSEIKVSVISSPPLAFGTRLEDSTIGSLTKQCRHLGLSTLGDRTGLIRRLEQHFAKGIVVPTSSTGFLSASTGGSQKTSRVGGMFQAQVPDVFVPPTAEQKKHYRRLDTSKRVHESAFAKSICPALSLERRLSWCNRHSSDHKEHLRLAAEKSNGREERIRAARKLHLVSLLLDSTRVSTVEVCDCSDCRI